MKTFTLTVNVPDNSVRDSVHIAQMVREAAATLEYQVPMKEHQHVYGAAGSQKYEWTVEEPETEPEPEKVRRVSRGKPEKVRRVKAAARH
jgi:hypothetical protein